MFARILGWAIGVLFATPSVAIACSCVQVATRDQAPRPWTDRARLFVGHALEVKETRTQSPRLTVRLVTEASWRGPMPDTVTLVVRRDAPCAEYVAGGRYLVAAELDSASTALVTSQCDDAWIIHYAGPKLAQLGTPTWVAPRMGQRALDATAIRLGASGQPTSSTDSLTFFVPREADIERFEMADWVGPANSTRLQLKPGLYQFRITWTDRTTYESYLLLRCEPPGRACRPFRFFSMLRPAI